MTFVLFSRQGETVRDVDSTARAEIKPPPLFFSHWRLGKDLGTESRTTEWHFPPVDAQTCTALTCLADCMKVLFNTLRVSTVLTHC